MTEIPEDDLEEGGSAMASVLEAAAAILPLLAKPQKLRYPVELNSRWVATCQRLYQAWTERHGEGSKEICPAVFSLYSLTLETGDIDCLRLGEALASAIDCLDQEALSPRIIAALSACVECLNETAGLEHPAFGERAQHFSTRLENCAANAKESNERSAVIDRLFVAETLERLEHMHDALAALPPDVETLLSETGELIQHAEHLSLYGIVHAARQLLQTLQQANRHNSLESEAIRAYVLTKLTALVQLTDAVNA